MPNGQVRAMDLMILTLRRLCRHIRVEWNSYKFKFLFVIFLLMLVAFCAFLCLLMCYHNTILNTIKLFWNEELDQMKNESVFWSNLWLSAGKPTCRCCSAYAAQQKAYATVKMNCLMKCMNIL